MDTDTLKCCLKTLLHHTSVKQYNVIARDQVSLIDFNIVPLALIINTDILKNPGKHWVAVYAWKQRDKIICDHYDSYGNNLKMYKIELPITLANFNNKVHQQNNSNVCGLHALRFLYKRSRGASLIAYNRLCSINPLVNDNAVKSFYKKIIQLKFYSARLKNAQMCCTRLENEF
jgi:hypothetical protein